MTADVAVAVVGRGMIGSAAARHLAESGVATALLGPDEPEDRRSSPGPFSSHPDEGRITRIAARSSLWADVAARSIARYADIEQRSGIRFHTSCGLVSVFAAAADWVERGRAFGSDARVVDPDWVLDQCGITLTNGLPAMFEGAPAGFINPRRLVAAQVALAEMAGARVIRHAVDRLERTAAGHALHGAWGSITADRVLLATGAFGADLLDAPLAIERRPRTTLMAEVAPDAAAVQVPSLIVDQPADPRLHEIYWVPPVRYPDGSLRLKIGGNLREFDPLEPGELTEWFHSDGSALEAEALENSLRALLPDAEFSSFTRAPCVITGTPSEHPYVGWVDRGLAVALAGNGSAAKSSDELGRLAATLFSDAGWDRSIPADLLAPQFAG